MQRSNDNDSEKKPKEYVPILSEFFDIPQHPVVKLLKADGNPMGKNARKRVTREYAEKRGKVTWAHDIYAEKKEAERWQKIISSNLDKLRYQADPAVKELRELLKGKNGKTFPKLQIRYVNKEIGYVAFSGDKAIPKGTILGFYAGLLRSRKDIVGDNKGYLMRYEYEDVAITVDAKLFC